MTARFYAPDAQTAGDVLSLPDDEARHLTRVLRLGVGDRVRVFNGRGDEFEATVESAAKSAAAVRVGNRLEPAPEPRVALTLVQAVLKGDKMDEVVRDAVMIGAAAIQPIVTARSEVSLATLERSRRQERWQRIAVSSVKQCGRAVVPPVLAPTEFTAWRAPALMLVEPRATADTIPIVNLPVTPPQAATVIVGPEGGWTINEIQRAASVCQLVSVGRRTLRADAMAIVALTALFTRWGEL